ncbi:MAG TPA: hypothetical protein VG893_05195 [Terracidiphilus sp.]|nr:hypothetical protein [Terracidiphilus sp.]
MIRRLVFCAQTIYFLIFSAILVPLDPAALQSWPFMLRELAVRLAIILPFQLASRIVMQMNRIEVPHITPSPEGNSLQSEHGSDRRSHAGPISNAIRWRLRIIMFCAMNVFAVQAVTQRHAWAQLMTGAPAGVLAAIGVVISALLWALLAAVLMMMWLFPRRTPRFINGHVEFRAKVPYAATAIALTAVLVYWGYRASWWGHQQLMNAILGRAANWIGLGFCWLCLLVLWIPKPGQMSAGQPESLHVVPRAENIDKDEHA